MRIGSRLEHFARALADTASIEDLTSSLESATRELGFDYFTLMQHVDLSGSLEGVVAITTYHRDWVERFTSRGYHRFDPVLMTSHHYGAPFTWDLIPTVIPLTKRQHRMFGEARRYGIYDGLTVPLHIPGERLASYTFASARPVASSVEQMAAAHVIATFGYQAARGLVLPPTRKPIPPPLTDRQIDCVALSAAGKTEWETSQILSVAPTTVHSHLTEAMRRYGVFNRQQLLFHALRDGLISFGEVQTI